MGWMGAGANAAAGSGLRAVSALFAGGGAGRGGVSGDVAARAEAFAAAGTGPSGVPGATAIGAPAGSARARPSASMASTSR